MSTKGKEYQLAIRIAGIVDKTFSTSLASTKTQLSTFTKTINAMDKDFTNLDKGFDKIMSAGQKCFSVIATAAGVAASVIGAATVAAYTVGSEFESAFAGVKKTVDATDEEFAKLRQNVLDMSREIPSSAANIAGVMEIAGQLGIAKEILTNFTETMINLGVSTNLSAEDAATALARLANITSMADYGEDGVSNYERLGSVVVDLGNKFATTEEEIVSMATNLAASGSMAGLTEDQILAVSAAMSSVGIAAEAGGSSMSRVLMQMQQAVETGAGEMEIYAKTAGMTAQEFGALFKTDAGKALTSFIEGLGGAGADSYSILEDLDLSTIRVRRALLSLAGAGDLLDETMEVANGAWEENTALAIEAGKRYETVESQMQILQNGVKELGIVAYDDLRDPLVDALGTVTDKVHDLTDYADGPNGIGNLIDNIGTELPTLQRKFKKYGEPVFDGIVGAGKWIVKHGNGIISVFAGIGATLAAYKTASTLTHVVKAIMALCSLNPATLGILGVVAAIGAATTAFAAYKQHEQDLIDSNLAEHFGNISLSMEELQAVAEHIIGADSLGGVQQALEAFGEVDTIAAEMENSIAEINKMNWKVSIGMELTADEQESYKTAIAEYVSAAQEYALQSQYAVSLNLSMGLGDAGIASKVNQFYQDSYDEMTILGQDLSDAVNDAFADNILDPKELDSITNLQAKIAEVQQSLATGEFDAKLSMLGMEYAGGGNLTAESFENLQAELDNQVAAATEAYKEAYTKNYAAIQATYDAGGYLTDAEYEKALAEVKETYLKNTGDAQMKALNFQLETIMQQYGDEVEIFRQHMETVAEKYSGEDYALAWQDTPVAVMDTMVQELYNNDLDSTTKKAIEELMTAMQPTIEQAEALKQEYSDLDIELSDEMLAAFANIDLLGAMTVRDALYGTNGDISSAYDLANSMIVDDERFAEAEETVRGYGWELPGAFAEGVTEAYEEAIPPAVDEMYNSTQAAIDESCAQGFTAEAEISIQLNPVFRNTTALNSYVSGLNSSKSLPNYALDLDADNNYDGGIIQDTTLSWLAEKGPESVIPLDGSRNAISLWEQTGRLLGMNSVLDDVDLDGGSGPVIEYSPTLQFYGEAPSKEDLTDALRVSQDEFESLMEQYIKKHGRVAFG